MMDLNQNLCKNLLHTIKRQIRDTAEDRYTATILLTEPEMDGITKGILAEYETHTQYLNSLQKKLEKDYVALLRRG